MHRLFPVTLTGALLLGCTQDFDQFAPVAGSGTTTPTTTSGGGGGTTTGSGGAGGAQGTGGQGTGGQGTGGVGGQSTGGSGGQGLGGAAPDAGGVEDCTNGKDDDGDGKTDCADPKCNAGFTCAPVAPAGGWSGPAWLFDGATASAPSCAGAFGAKAYEGFRDMAQVPALCGQCACEAATGTCAPGSLFAYDDAACSQQGGGHGQTPASQCVDLSAPLTTSSYKAAPPVFSNGSCKANKPGSSKPAPTWATTGLVCGGPTPGGGCDAQGEVCAPRPAPPFGASLCIWGAGAKDCPAAYPQKHTFWDGATDGRECSPCACGVAAGSCTATTTVYEKSCQNQNVIGVVPNDGACHAFDGSPARLQVDVQASGACPASGGQATGTVVEGPGSTTVCCAP